MISDAVDAYYEAIHAAQNRTQVTDTMTRWVDQARGDDLRKASLIHNDYPAIDILVAVSEADQAALNHYRDLRDRAEAGDSEVSYYDQQRAFDALKELIVSVPVSATTLETDNRNGDDEDSNSDIDELYAIERGEHGYDPADGRGVRGNAVRFDTQV